jgi:hypothetical protein
VLTFECSSNKKEISKLPFNTSIKHHKEQETHLLTQRTGSQLSHIFAIIIINKFNENIQYIDFYKLGPSGASRQLKMLFCVE